MFFHRVVSAFFLLILCALAHLPTTSSFGEEDGLEGTINDEVKNRRTEDSVNTFFDSVAASSVSKHDMVKTNQAGATARNGSVRRLNTYHTPTKHKTKKPSKKNKVLHCPTREDAIFGTFYCGKEMKCKYGLRRCKCGETYHMVKCKCEKNKRLVCKLIKEARECAKLCNEPTANPTAHPTHAPTPYPTLYPTPYPTPYPTNVPTRHPTPYRTHIPTPLPTHKTTPVPHKPLTRSSSGAIINTEQLRFNKIPQIVGFTPPAGPHLPMIAANYPLSQHDATWLRQTGAISVFRYEDCRRQECDMHPLDLIVASKVPIWHPSSNPTDPFWPDLEAVVDAQINRRNNLSPLTVLKTMPQFWANFDIHQVAEAVHDEFPGSIHIELLKEMFGGALDKPYSPNCAHCALIDRTIIESQSLTEFIRGAVMLSDINTWAFGSIGPLNFSVKWYVGRARPEEIVWEIFNNRLTEIHGVPPGLANKIRGMGLTSMQSFTAYPEGSPDHPSWPAMHSASSAASLWMAVVMDLTTEQWCEVKAVDYAISFARTVAGVHYPTDNIAGLNIGQHIMAKRLPKFLAEKYGSNLFLVEQKVQRVRFDWNDYLNSECFY